MQNRREHSGDDDGDMFADMIVFFVDRGIHCRRLQVWKQKLLQMGASIEPRLSKNVTHVFAADAQLLRGAFADDDHHRYKGKILTYQWIEDSLGQGTKLPEESYRLHLNADAPADEAPERKKVRSDSDNRQKTEPSRDEPMPSAGTGAPLPYSPPDLNKNITGIFNQLIGIYRAMGDDRRSFSYYKAISVIEKLPFEIQSGDQVRDLPAIGKSMRDHVNEIVTTGKLLKLEHFGSDERVKTIALFGEVWGIGPATALKLYGKGHRTLQDLEGETSLTNAQRLGLKYFDDMKVRIPREEAREMEGILQKTAEEVLPGVAVLCGGSFRRGKSSCGDLDVVITHPDGRSHAGFMAAYVKRLKEMKFLREDLVFAVHSEKEGSEFMVDTYFGLCAYPGTELRHRIDLKVYPAEIYAFGLIAWTGNDVVNRRLRLLAESKGYRLDDTGLFLATRDSGGKRGGDRAMKSLSLKTEREVFDFLGFPWLEPHERNL